MEGVVIVEVLKSGEEGGKFICFLVWGVVVGVLVKLFELGLKFWNGVVEGVILVGKKVYFYFGMNLLFVLIVVGYIVGICIVVLVFIGGVVSWWIVIFVYIVLMGVFEGIGVVDMGYSIWSS